MNRTALSPVSVVMPVNRWDDAADRAAASILAQTQPDFELLLVLNGDDPGLAAAASIWTARDPRVRTCCAPREHLAVALNTGVRAARHELIARMDADDESHPERLARQTRLLDERRDLAGAGTGAAFIGPDGAVQAINLPPVDPRESRWRLMVWNPFTHGSMMLRRDAVLEVGGYDETLRRGQDYDLWLRLASRGLGGVSEVLYTHHVRTTDSRLDHDQATATTRRLLDAWAGLRDDVDDAEVQRAMADLAAGDAVARTRLEAWMEAHGPTRAALTAWLWSAWRCPIPPTAADARRTRVEAGARLLRTHDVASLHLYGAGDFARFLIAHETLLGVRIDGVVDDARAGGMLEDRRVRDPEDLNEDDVVLIASDLYEDEIWTKSQALRARGVTVLRLPPVLTPTPVVGAA